MMLLGSWETLQEKVGYTLSCAVRCSQLDSISLAAEDPCSLRWHNITLINYPSARCLRFHLLFCYIWEDNLYYNIGSVRKKTKIKTRWRASTRPSLRCFFWDFFLVYTARILKIGSCGDSKRKWRSKSRTAARISPEPFINRRAAYWEKGCEVARPCTDLRGPNSGSLTQSLAEKKSQSRRRWSS